MDARDKTKIIVVLLLIVNVLNDAKKYKKSMDLAKQLGKVKKHADKCAIMMGALKMSRGAERDKDKYSALMFAERVPLVGRFVTAKSMTQELIACDGLLHSVRTNLHPKGNEWWWLAQSLERLTKDFINMFPEYEDWELYSKFDEVLGI